MPSRRGTEGFVTRSLENRFEPRTIETPIQNRAAFSKPDGGMREARPLLQAGKSTQILRISREKAPEKHRTHFFFYGGVRYPHVFFVDLTYASHLYLPRIVPTSAEISSNILAEFFRLKSA